MNSVFLGLGVEAVLIGFLHRLAFLLIALETLSSSWLDRQVVGMSSSAIVALGVSLGRNRALLLDEDSLERCTSASILYHHLLLVCHHIGRVASWVVLLFEGLLLA